jgi:hypothetical protein
MTTMSADFHFRGVSGYGPATEDPYRVSVRLMTDGTVVGIDKDPFRGDGPKLTTEGWAEFAIAAAALVREANAAWKNMGAEK